MNRWCITTAQPWVRTPRSSYMVHIPKSKQLVFRNSQENDTGNCRAVSSPISISSSDTEKDLNVKARKSLVHHVWCARFFMANWWLNRVGSTKAFYSIQLTLSEQQKNQRQMGTRFATRFLIWSEPHHTAKRKYRVTATATLLGQHTQLGLKTGMEPYTDYPV